MNELRMADPECGRCGRPQSQHGQSTAYCQQTDTVVDIGCQFTDTPSAARLMEYLGKIAPTALAALQADCRRSMGHVVTNGPPAREWRNLRGVEDTAWTRFPCALTAGTETYKIGEDRKTGEIVIFVGSNRTYGTHTSIDAAKEAVGALLENRAMQYLCAIPACRTPP